MELRTLHYFLTVATEQNITHAARKLNISQPPLSRQLAQLEEELGVTLFIRGKRRIQLTEEGKYLAQQAQHILDMAQHTAQQLAQMKSQEVKGTLLLGITETCSAIVLPGILPEFSRLYPQVSYNIWCGSSNDVSQRVEQGLLDIGVVRDPISMENLEFSRISEEAWIAVVPKGHPLAAKEAAKRAAKVDIKSDTMIGTTPESPAATLAQICQYPLFIPSRQPLQNEVHNWLSSNGVSYHVIGMYNQISSIIPLVTENMGIAIAPPSIKKYTDDRKLAYIDIAPPSLVTGIYMVCARRKLLSAGARAFWDFTVLSDKQSHPSDHPEYSPENYPGQ